VINDSWRLAPWADLLYACDFAWWRLHGGVPQFAGTKVSQDEKACRKPWGVRQVHVTREQDRLLLDTPGVLGWGGNSGFHALNLAAQFGVRRIVLVGYDMTLANGVHWHGPHPSELNNPMAGNVARWRRVIEAAATTLTGLGIEVLNASPMSALEAYPKVKFEDALAC